MALYTLETSADSAAVDRIQTFIKHINVNSQYNYNVSGLISENSSTPVKNMTPKSLSASLCENSNDDISKDQCFSEEKDMQVDTTNPKDVSHNSKEIDDNITRALNALRSPRLSLPTSNEKEPGSELAGGEYQCWPNSLQHISRLSVDN